MLCTGRIRSWLKSFGFVTPDDPMQAGAWDIFLHWNQRKAWNGESFIPLNIPKGQYVRHPQVGAKVIFLKPGANDVTDKGVYSACWALEEDIFVTRA